eukprot:TRINITY_DN27948_c0_g2_i3.p1 TRINITY_DN27948_c0_g2~~TRINITY_DN27948_c0_g2_i3.p1  ORF type:complete len:222 (+),score=-19.81 TRINITY_DN27948_c0_g2_i3:597-1262(+)
MEVRLILNNSNSWDQRNPESANSNSDSQNLEIELVRIDCKQTQMFFIYLQIHPIFLLQNELAMQKIVNQKNQHIGKYNSNQKHTLFKKIYPCKNESKLCIIQTQKTLLVIYKLRYIRIHCMTTFFQRININTFLLFRLFYFVVLVQEFCEKCMHQELKIHKLQIRLTRQSNITRTKQILTYSQQKGYVPFYLKYTVIFSQSSSFRLHHNYNASIQYFIVYY